MEQTPAPTTLHRMTQTTPTALWDDSCSFQELSASIEQNGTAGATCNPLIVLGVLKFEDFRRAYREDGLRVEEFDADGATARTLRQFCKATEDPAALIRDFMIPDPGA
jgi:hypothetical protein